MLAQTDHAASVPSDPLADLPPEGPPTAAPSTGPKLVLDPDSDALRYPPKDPMYDVASEGDDAAGPDMLIYQVDVESLPEKPWRRPGTNMSDWFNYGFDENTWALWCQKMAAMDTTRADLAAQVPPSAMNTVFLPSGEPAPVQPNASASAFPGMFGPGGMMGMPAWPMMGMLPPQGDASQSMDASASPAIPMVPGMPPLDHDASSMPAPGDDAVRGPHTQPPGGDTDSHRPDTGRRGPRSRSGRSGGRRHGGRHDDHDGPQDGAPRYFNDRDHEAGASDALDYGGHAVDDGWRSRRQRDTSAADEAYDPDQFGSLPSQRDGPQDLPRRPEPGPVHDRGAMYDRPRDRGSDRGHDRPSRRERERARHDRRSGRGGQKRGLPDHGDDPQGYSSKRFNGGGHS